MPSWRPIRKHPATRIRQDLEALTGRRLTKTEWLNLKSQLPYEKAWECLTIDDWESYKKWLKDLAAYAPKRPVQREERAQVKVRLLELQALCLPEVRGALPYVRGSKLSSYIEYSNSLSAQEQLTDSKICAVEAALKRLQWLYGWNRAEALVFLFEGKLPEWAVARESLAATVHICGDSIVPYWRVIITVDPWAATEKELKEQVIAALDRVLNSARANLRRDLHRQELKPCSQLAYEALNLRLDYPRLSWSKFLTLWNERHPEHAFKHRETLRNYVERACKELTGLSFNQLCKKLGLTKVSTGPS